MAIKKSVSNDFCSAFIDSINSFDCRLSGVGPVAQDLLPTLKFVAHIHTHILKIMMCTSTETDLTKHRSPLSMFQLAVYLIHDIYQRSLTFSME